MRAITIVPGQKGSVELNEMPEPPEDDPAIPPVDVNLQPKVGM